MKDIPTSSVQQYLVQYFFIIGKYIAWKVGLGKKVRVGSDAIFGCNNAIYFHRNP
jgi:hypothetical protein